MKWLRRVGWVLLGVLVLWAVAWLVVPPLLKSQAQKQLGDMLGRSVSFGEVDFRPWSMELTVRDIVIGGLPSDASAAPLLKVARLYANADIRSLWELAPVVEAFEIDAPEVRLTHTAPGHYDIDDILARLAARPAQPPSGEPMHFAVYNIKVSDASFAFDDRPKDRRHRVESLQLGLPFVTNLPTHVKVKIEPRLAFKFNGTDFDTGAQATPFAETRDALLQFKMGELDLAPYTVYLPESLPVRLTSGVLAGHIDVNFSMPKGTQPSVAVSGEASLQKIGLTDASGAPLVSWDRLGVTLREVRPLDRRLALGSIDLDGPVLHLSRDAQGRLNLAQLASGAPKDAAAAESTPAASAAQAASGPEAGTQPPVAAAKPADAPWKVALDSLNVGGLKVLWNDATVKPAAALALDAVDLKAGPLAYPFAADASLPLSLKATLAAQAQAGSLGQFALDGQLSDRKATLDLKLDQLSLDAFAPYVASAVTARVSGRLSTGGQLNWAAAPVAAQAAQPSASGASPAAALTLSHGELVLDELRVTDGRKLPAVALKQFAVREVELDALARTVVLGSVKLDQPAVAVARDRDGLWNVQRWMKPVAAPAPLAAGAKPKSPASAGSADAQAPWRVDLRDLALDGGSVRVDDAQVPTAEPVLLVLRSMKLGVQKLVMVGSRTESPAAVQFSARLASNETARAPDKSIKLAAGSATAGAMDWRGQIGLQPLMVKGALKLDRLPVQAFEPYVRDRLPVHLQRVEAGLKADVSVRELPAGMDVSLSGDALIADVKVQTRGAALEAQGLDASNELLSWNSLKLNGVKLAMAPAQPMRVDITEVVLSDFFARLILNEAGRFNLQDVQPANAPAQTAAAAPAAAPAVPAAPAAAPPAESPPMQLSVGGTRLVNGRVDFTDRFVRPSYSADLSELNGTLGAFSSSGGGMAKLDLKGRAARTALLEIAGQFNPTAQPPVLDIRARATDLELAPLSPYSGKYAGYAIERGKLSMDLAYKISPDGQLEARNQVILNQLTFGERVESPTATSLPVLLAVSLLKDSNGVIDINLPIRGSLKDPQFSIGALVVKVIVNVLTKAITAPFSLLFGSDEADFSQIEFKPGSALMTETGEAALDKVAKSLTDKPSLKLTVTGACDPQKEHDDYQQVVLEARLQKEKAKEKARDGQAPDVAGKAAPEALSAAERERLLKVVYKQTDIPDKPRNLIGMAKDVPAAEMEALLKTVIPVNEDLMRELALQRGLTVRDGLVAKGLPSERLFVGAPKPRAAFESVTDRVPGAQLVLKND